MARNDLIYQQKQTNSEEILAWAQKLQQEYYEALHSSPSIIPGDTPIFKHPIRDKKISTISVKWSIPNINWIKINTDGAARGHPGFAGVGFICRDSGARSLLALAQPLGITTALTAETWAMLLVSRTSTERKWPRVLFETDSENLLRFITSSTPPPWHIAGMIEEIKIRFQQIPQAAIQHNYREGNQVADGLANHAADESQTGSSSTKIWDQAIPSLLAKFYFMIPWVPHTHDKL